MNTTTQPETKCDPIAVCEECGDDKRCGIAIVSPFKLIPDYYCNDCAEKVEAAIRRDGYRYLGADEWCRPHHWNVIVAYRRGRAD